MDELLDHDVSVLMPYLVPDKDADVDGSVMCFRAGRAVLRASRFNRKITLSGRRSEIKKSTWDDLVTLYDNYNGGEDLKC